MVLVTWYKYRFQETSGDSDNSLQDKKRKKKKRKKEGGTAWLEIDEHCGQLDERSSLHLNDNVYAVTTAYRSVSMKTVTGPYYFRQWSNSCLWPFSLNDTQQMKVQIDIHMIVNNVQQFQICTFILLHTQ